jgi:hypothetical protein
MNNLRIIPAESWFRLGELRELLGLPAGTLPREIRLGRLRSAKRAGMRWVKGEWAAQWLEGGEIIKSPRREAQAVAAG